jgi:hypothetical protein
MAFERFVEALKRHKCCTFLNGGVVTRSKNAIGEIRNFSCCGAQCAGTGGLWEALSLCLA